jgi:parvulin-like peptidyl-prolyl isomerase
VTARRLLTLSGPVLPLVVLVALPFNGLGGFYLDLFYFTFTYAAMSVGWNIIGGYTGYISLANLGFFGLDSGFVKEFTDPLFTNTNLKPGDIVGPIQTQFGYHVILFQERVPGAVDRLKTVTDALAATGADFAAIAKQYSDGDEALIGGELGWRTQAQLPTDLGTAAFALQAGQTSPSVKLADGYHIVKVEERASRPLDQAQIAEVSASAFSSWYDPQKTKAEADKVITKDSSIFSSTSSGSGG